MFYLELCEMNVSSIFFDKRARFFTSILFIVVFDNAT